MDAVSEVKARLNIEDVVSQYVQLKRAGRNFKGLSPFTNEKTPSFMVSPEKQIWHDFSSGKGGNIFSFIMEVEGVDFRGALELLAARAGVDLEQYGSNSAQNSQIRKRLLEALELATHFYQKQLVAHETALKYLLKKRLFSKQTLLTWRLGYSPVSGKSLQAYLTKRGFSSDEIKHAGLSTTRREGPSDMFRGRIMIPLCNPQGVVIGFTARLLAEADEGAPKYINTPKTWVYDKSRHVFGLHLAKESIRKTGFAVVVEGNMDVLASYQAEVTNVVATAGTAMTQLHLKELKRFSRDIRLSFDSDQAGIGATERIIPMAQKTGVDLSIISISGAKDPDELIQKDVRLWKKAIKAKAYATDWLIDCYQKRLDLSSAAGKKTFTDVILPTLRRLEDSVEQEHYVHLVAGLTDSSLETIRTKLASQSAEGDSEVRRKPKTSPQPASWQLEHRKLEDHFLAMVLAEPRLRNLLDNLTPSILSDGPPRQLVNFLKKNPQAKAAQAGSLKLQDISDYVKIITLQFEELYRSLESAELAEQAALLKNRLVTSYVRSQKQAITLVMQQTTDDLEMAKLIKKVDQLSKLIKH